MIAPAARRYNETNFRYRPQPITQASIFATHFILELKTVPPRTTNFARDLVTYNGQISLIDRSHSPKETRPQIPIFCCNLRSPSSNRSITYWSSKCDSGSMANHKKVIISKGRPHSPPAVWEGVEDLKAPIFAPAISTLKPLDLINFEGWPIKARWPDRLGQRAVYRPTLWMCFPIRVLLASECDCWSSRWTRILA